MVVNKVELCGVNTSKLPLLKEKEKEELFRRIRQGDKLAREEYIKGNLRLVLSVMKRFDSSNENADDLFQIGCVGLVKAVDNFDPDRQVKFSTYAVPMIIGEIRRYLRDNSSLRVSRSLRDIAYKVIYTREGYIRKNMKEPSIQEIAEEIGLSKEEVVYALDAVQTPMSLLPVMIMTTPASRMTPLLIRILPRMKAPIPHPKMIPQLRQLRQLVTTAYCLCLQLQQL